MSIWRSDSTGAEPASAACTTEAVKLNAIKKKVSPRMALGEPDEQGTKIARLACRGGIGRNYNVGSQGT